MRDAAATGLPDARRLARLQRVVLAIATALPIAFVALLVVARWPEYWRWINYEATPMTTLEVATMFATALIAAAAGARAWLSRAPGATIWWLLAAAFLWFACDDRFALHERLRDRVLAPHGVSIPFLPWVAPGDFILIAYAAAGLCLLPSLWRLLRPHPAARWRLCAGAIVAALAVALDSVDLALLTVPMQRLEQTVEECLELAAQVLFLQAFLCAWLGEIAGARDGEPPG
jgi:hypothetical protein